MTKETASRHILLILVVTLIAATGLVFGVVMAKPVYADAREIELEYTDGSDLWSDSNLTIIVPEDYLSGIDYFSTNVSVRVKGKDQWLNQNDHFSCSNDSATWKLFLKGDEIFKAVGEGELVISVSFRDQNDEEIAYGSNEVNVRESQYNYDLPQYDRIPFEGDGQISNKLNVWAQNKDYPNGKDDECDVTNLEAVSEGADEILSIESNEDGWTYKGLKEGKTRVRMTYKDFKDSDMTHRHEFTVTVVVLNPSEYSLWVGDKPVTSANAENITGSDPVQASYDAASNTLTLNNYTYEGYGIENDKIEDTDKAAIQARMDGELTINLNGENTLKHLYKDSSMGAGILVAKNLKVTGNGTLTVSDGDRDGDVDSRGIRVGQELTIRSGAAVNAASGKARTVTA